MTSSAALSAPLADAAPAPFPWVPLASRLVLFAALQAVVAGALAATGSSSAWHDSAAWWPVVVVVANLLSIALLVRSARAQGRDAKSFLHVDGSKAGRDALLLLGVALLAAPIAMVPTLGLATLLFGDAETALAMFVRPLPAWAALVGAIGFPLTIAFSELPTYYADALPRLEARGWSRWRALAVAAAFHSAQHATLPLIFDARFFVWRLVMFLPFAFYVGYVVRRRPSLLPWLMGFHALIDAAVGLQIWAAAIR